MFTNNSQKVEALRDDFFYIARHVCKKLKKEAKIETFKNYGLEEYKHYMKIKKREDRNLFEYMITSKMIGHSSKDLLILTMDGVLLLAMQSNCEYGVFVRKDVLSALDGFKNGFQFSTKTRELLSNRITFRTRQNYFL